MAGEIQNAIDRMNERKAALVQGLGGEGEETIVIDAEQKMPLYAGLDIDADQLEQFAEVSAAMVAKLVKAGFALSLAVETIALDSLLVGALVAEKAAEHG